MVSHLISDLNQPLRPDETNEMIIADGITEMRCIDPPVFCTVSLSDRYAVPTTEF